MAFNATLILKNYDTTKFFPELMSKFKFFCVFFQPFFKKEEQIEYC